MTMIKLRSIFICIFILSSVIFMTGGTYTGGQAYEIARGGELNLLLFDADGRDSGIIITADKGTVYYRVDSDGNILYSLDLPENIFAAYIYGQSVYCLRSEKSRILMNEISIEDGGLLNSFYIKTSEPDISFICGDALGNIYYVIKGQGSTVYKCDAGGYSQPFIELDSAVTFCGVTDDTLIYSHGSSISKVPVYAEAAPDTVPADTIPAKFFSPNLMVDTKGVFCSLSDSAEPLYNSGNNWDADMRLSHFMDENSCFYSVKDSSTVEKLGDSGGALYNAPGTIRGLNANGIMVLDGGALKFSPYSSYNYIDDTPSPEPGGEDDAEFYGEYIIVQAGRTVTSVNDAFGAEIYYNGRPAAAGVCRTGMTVEISGDIYTVIILGDVNGSGTVNSADIKLIQSHMIGKAVLEEPPLLFAADYSRNGLIETEDLVLIAKSISQ